MIHFDLPKEQSSIIKVIGVGGGGSNAVNYMHSLGITGVDFMVCNTDAQALALSKVPNKIQLGPSLTQGLGAGANPQIGKQATEESLEEIRRILEVNTKMAFVTAGMGGGTGTGGAPIIANICREMGILTVGIVTTPFSYEGKKRSQHANHGIEEMKACVDTLLVISNDKLRHQFGNLTMSAALSTADNVLATAAKCITDVINTTGQINVDFADVCTVMRNGGVAILGSARASGENRAQVAIEQALNSPLLDDNDIRGAKWVLININSKAGDTEFTMDEVDSIQQHLLTMAGPDADVILGLGYDDSLGDEIGITIIATGFETKSTQGGQNLIEAQAPKDDKIMFTLDMAPKPIAEIAPVFVSVEQVAEVKQEDIVVEQELQVELAPTMVVENEIESKVLVYEEIVVDEAPVIFELDLSVPEPPVLNENISQTPVSPTMVQEEKPISVAPMQQAKPVSGGFLVKPSVIYKSDFTPVSPMPEVTQPIAEVPKMEEPEAEVEETMHLIFKEEVVEPTPVMEQPILHQPIIEEPAPFDEAEAQKAKAAERLYKLRNLSYNFNAADPNNEYENIPAYVRHNLQVHNTTLATVEKFYSSYSIGTDENNVSHISTINTFLEGKKPD
jgi:cell division protein FtsZ